jgi:hypothetical protein
MIKKANKIQSERNQSEEMTSKTDKIHSRESRRSEISFPSISLLFYLLFLWFLQMRNCNHFGIKYKFGEIILMMILVEMKILNFGFRIYFYENFVVKMVCFLFFISKREMVFGEVHKLHNDIFPSVEQNLTNPYILTMVYPFDSLPLKCYVIYGDPLLEIQGTFFA